MAGRFLGGWEAKDELQLKILWCNLNGDLQEKGFWFERNKPIWNLKTLFTEKVDWRDILGDSTKDRNLADALMMNESKFADLRHKACVHVWGRFYNFVFDHMALEDDATPYGLGLVDGDTIALSRKKEYCEKEYILNNEISLEYMATGRLHAATNEMSKRNNVHNTMVAKTKRKAEEISVGLNVLIGEPDGLPIIQGDCFSHPTPEAAEICQTQLKNMETALLPALGMTMKDCELPLPHHLPDFSPIMSNLLEKKYKHSHDCMKEISNVLISYKTSAVVVANADIKYGGVSGKEEGAKREMLLRRLKATVKEFQFATSSIHINDPNSIDNSKVYYIGPARNSSPENFLASLPTVQLKGVNTNTTLQDLVHSYKTYTENTGFKVPSLLYDNEGYKLDMKVNAVCTHPYPGFNKFYFSFPYDPSIKQEDTRDINDLLEYIEGDEDKKSSEKKKKRKKKRKNITPEKEKETSETDNTVNNLEVVKDSFNPVKRNESDNEDDFDDSSEVNCFSFIDGKPLTVSTKDLSSLVNCYEMLSTPTDFTTPFGNNSLLADIVSKDNDALKQMKSEFKLSMEKEKPSQQSKEEKYLQEIQEAISKRVEVELEVKKTKLDTLKSEKTTLEKSLEVEMKLFDAHKDNVQSIIDSKAKEMKNFIIMIEKTEDEKNLKSKKVTDIDSQLSELEAKMIALNDEKRKLIKECDQKDDQIKKFAKKQNKLENFIATELSKAKEEGNRIEAKMQDIRNKLAENEKSLQNLPNEHITYPPVKQSEPNKQLLDFIDKQIEEKEKELECPVCFEISTIPIFMCSELHLICSNCRPKVAECPECRLAYSGKPKRHRYAEKAAEDLARLRRERQELIKDNC